MGAICGFRVLGNLWKGATVIVEKFGTPPHHLHEFSATDAKVDLRVMLQDVRVEGISEFERFINITVEDGGAYV